MNVKKIPHTVLLCLLTVLVCAPLPAVRFRFQYAAGDAYRILSTVRENVLVNGRFDHYAEIVNRISVEVTEATESSGNHTAVFMTTENSTGTGNTQFTWGEEYTSIFTRDSSGRYVIGDEYFMPVVRDVPLFPDEELSPGDTWTAAGHEAHDMRRTFDLKTPYKVPFTASYTYTGTTEKDGRTLHIIEVRYNLYFDSPSPAETDTAARKNVNSAAHGTAAQGASANSASANSASANGGGAYRDYPVTTMGYSHQTIYWDNERGTIDHYNEDFRIIVESAYGNTFEFSGKAQAEVQEFASRSADRLADVRERIDQLGIENAQVRADEKGLTISLENIQFKADSAVLLESEKMKLRKIAEILSLFPENDLLITGHTALAGTAASRTALSEQRAKAVAEYLMQLGIRDSYHIFTQGLGGEHPIAPNTTEANKARNRRVEITVMDK